MAGTFRTTVDIAWPYLRRYKRGIAIGSACLLGKTVLAVINPLIIRDGFDALLAGFAVGKLMKFAAMLGGFAVLRGVMQFYARLILVSISRDVEFDMRNDLFAHLVRLSADFYRKMRTGDIMARATNDLNQVRMMLGPGVMYWAETTLTTILAIAVMASVDWQMTMIALIPAPLVSFVVVYFGQKIHKRFEKIQAQFSDISSRVQENLNGVRIVRAYAQEEAELKKFETLNLAYIILGLAGLFAWKRRKWILHLGPNTPKFAFRELAIAMAASILLRAALLLTLDNSEPRYTLEFFPVMFVLAGALFAEPLHLQSTRERGGR